MARSAQQVDGQPGPWATQARCADPVVSKRFYDNRYFAQPHVMCTTECPVLAKCREWALRYYKVDGYSVGTVAGMRPWTIRAVQLQPETALMSHEDCPVEIGEHDLGWHLSYAHGRQRRGVKRGDFTDHGARSLHDIKARGWSCRELIKRPGVNGAIFTYDKTTLTVCYQESKAWATSVVLQLSPEGELLSLPRWSVDVLRRHSPAKAIKLVLNILLS